MNIDEEATMKDFYKSIDFEKMDKNAKKKARLSILITMPLTLLSIFFLTISWNNEDIFLNNIYSILFCVPIWIALFCSILSYKFENGLALERLSVAPKSLIYIVVTLPMYTLIHTDVFNISNYQQNLIFTIFGSITSIISLVSLVVIVVMALRYEGKGISAKEKFIQSWKEYGMSEQEVEELLNGKD